MPERSTRMNMIAALIALALASLLMADAGAQTQSGRAERGNNGQQTQQGSAAAVSAELPDVDRLSRSGWIFTDWYSRQSCTSGRAAFETGRYPARVGLTRTWLNDPK